MKTSGNMLLRIVCGHKALPKNCQQHVRIHMTTVKMLIRFLIKSDIKTCLRKPINWVIISRLFYNLLLQLNCSLSVNYNHYVHVMYRGLISKSILIGKWRQRVMARASVGVRLSWESIKLVLRKQYARYGKHVCKIKWDDRWSNEKRRNLNPWEKFLEK